MAGGAGTGGFGRHGLQMVQLMCQVVMPPRRHNQSVSTEKKALLLIAEGPGRQSTALRIASKQYTVCHPQSSQALIHGGGTLAVIWAWTPPPSVRGVRSSLVIQAWMWVRWWGGGGGYTKEASLVAVLMNPPATAALPPISA